MLRLRSSALQTGQMDFLASQAPALFKGIRNLLHISFFISWILVLSAHSWQRYYVNSVYLSWVRYMQQLSKFLLTIVQVFCSLGNQHCCILSAAVKLNPFISHFTQPFYH